VFAIGFFTASVSLLLCVGVIHSFSFVIDWMSFFLPGCCHPHHYRYQQEPFFSGRWFANELNKLPNLLSFGGGESQEEEGRGAGRRVVPPTTSSSSSSSSGATTSTSAMTAPPTSPPVLSLVCQPGDGGPMDV
jgi:hypothetical protein